MNDREELERFCADAYPVLVGALAHHVGDRWLAEELAQEALLRLCGRWSRVRHLRSPVGWAFRVGVNVANSQFRRRQAERRARARHGPEPAVHQEPDTTDRLAVRQALLSLPPRQREVVVLRYYLGLSAEETAEIVGGTAGAVRATTHRAVVALRDVLDVGDVEEIANAS